MSQIKKTNFLGLPEEVIFCKKCVISNQRPSSVIEFKNKQEGAKPTIDFDDNEICSACNYNSEKEKINWEEREKELIDLCKSYKSKKGNYDCVVPGSGGKDSAYTAHVLKYKYGMNPITVTWAPHAYTNIGWQNFQNWSHIGGFDNILFTPNGKLHRYLTKIAFLNLLHPFQPFIIGQRMIGPRIASRFGIDLIFYGENQAEYGNKIDENYKTKMDKKFFTYENRDELLFGGKKINEIINTTEFKFNDFNCYLPLDKNEFKGLDLNYQYLGYYLKWDPQECFYYASKHTGFKPNSERTEGSYSKYSSIDDKIDNFHYYTTLIKFGIGRATYDAAQEIRNKKITREEAVALVKKFDHEFPKKYFKDFLEYINITEKEFFQTVDKFRSPHLWVKKNDEWLLKKGVWLEN